MNTHTTTATSTAHRSARQLEQEARAAEHQAQQAQGAADQSAAHALRLLKLHDDASAAGQQEQANALYASYLDARGDFNRADAKATRATERAGIARQIADRAQDISGSAHALQEQADEAHERAICRAEDVQELEQDNGPEAEEMRAQFLPEARHDAERAQVLHNQLRTIANAALRAANVEGY